MNKNLYYRPQNCWILRNQASLWRSLFDIVFANDSGLLVAMSHSLAMTRFIFITHVSSLIMTRLMNVGQSAILPKMSLRPLLDVYFQENQVFLYKSTIGTFLTQDIHQNVFGQFREMLRCSANSLMPTRRFLSSDSLTFTMFSLLREVDGSYEASFRWLCDLQWMLIATQILRFLIN